LDDLFWRETTPNLTTATQAKAAHAPWTWTGLGQRQPPTPTMIHMQAVRYVHHQVRKRRSFIIRSYKALFLLKGLIVALLLVSVYLHALLQAVTSSSSNAADVNEVNVCVGKGMGRCQFYPCEERGGVIKEVISPNPVFGYAGSFVRRVENITKPIPECE
jgi:hypothetical protein